MQFQVREEFPAQLRIKSHLSEKDILERLLEAFVKKSVE